MKTLNNRFPELFFANCGDGTTRKWIDSYKFKFISAGQGDLEKKKAGFFSNQLKRLIVGDILAVYRNGIGYVAIGRVTDKAISINEILFNGVKLKSSDFTFGSNMFRNADNAYQECLVKVEWLTDGHLGTLPASGKCYGIFAKQHVIASLANQLHLRNQLEKEFGISFKNYLSEY